MGYPAWRKQRVARSESEPFLSNLNDELAFNGVEPLVLVVMQVPSRTTLCVERVFENEETTMVLRGHLEVNGADAKSPMLTKSVFACCNLDYVWELNTS
jgi:hypothetical protein